MSAVSLVGMRDGEGMERGAYRGLYHLRCAISPYSPSVSCLPEHRWLVIVPPLRAHMTNCVRVRASGIAFARRWDGGRWSRMSLVQHAGGGNDGGDGPPSLLLLEFSVSHVPSVLLPGIAISRRAPRIHAG